MCVCVCVCVCVCFGSIVSSSVSIFMYFPIYPRLSCFAFSVLTFSFFLCRPFVVDIVDALVVAVFGLCESHTLIVLVDSCTPTRVFELILLTCQAQPGSV